MYDARTIKALVDGTIKDSGGAAPFVIAAHSEEEAEAIRAALRGRHGTKFITVEVFSAEFFKPVAPRWAEGEAK